MKPLFAIFCLFIISGILLKNIEGAIHPYKINMGYKPTSKRFQITLIATDQQPPYRYVVYGDMWMGSVDEQTWVPLTPDYIHKYNLNSYLHGQ